MRNKSLIDSMLLTSASLPKAGDHKFRMYSDGLKTVIRDNISDIREITFHAAEHGDPASFHLEWKYSYRVSDTFPNLETSYTFEIDPTQPLMPQIENIQKRITEMKQNLLHAARAIVKAQMQEK